jgi:hypothetical protein
MNEMIYSGPSYAMGASDVPASKAQADAALKKMKKSLQSWLKFRQRMDDYVMLNPNSPSRGTLRGDRYAAEQDLAENLYALLSEAGIDPSSLPSPDVARDPDAAVKLADIALEGKAPSEVASAQSQGIVWFVLAIPIAGVVLVLSQLIKSKAELAAQKERNRFCAESNTCTDSGFWLKWTGIVIVGWLAWDKFGLREAVEKRKRK